MNKFSKQKLLFGLAIADLGYNGAWQTVETGVDGGDQGTERSHHEQNYQHWRQHRSILATSRC